MVTRVSSVLDAARGDLVLRILGTNRHGQVVRIRSPKCTIGAGPQCTVRLHAHGLYPVHCLILRGPGATIVRRWAPDTLLNGESFTDSALRAGDRLSVGRIQFEVLSGSQGAGERGASPLPLNAPSSEERFAERLAALQARLGLANRQGRQRLRRLVEELRAARKLANTPPQATLVTASETTLQPELAERQCQLEEKALELQNRELELMRQVQSLESELTALDKLRHDLDQQQIRWRAEKEASDKAHHERLAELEARRQQLQNESDSLAGQRAQWESVRSEAASTQDLQSQQLDEQLAALRAERQAVDEARRGLEAERGEARQEADRCAKELADREAEFESSLAALERNQRDWQQQCHDREADLARESGELDEARRSLETDRAEARQEMERRAKELADRETELERRQRDWLEQCRQQEAALEDERQELESRWDELQSERDARQHEREQWESQRSEEEAVLPRTQIPQEIVDESESPGAQMPSRGVALDSMEVFRRLGTMPQLDDDREPAPAPTAVVPPSAAAAEPVEPAEPAGEKSADPGPEQASGHEEDHASGHEEDSVDVYMARLLQRVRGITESPQPPAASATSPVDAELSSGPIGESAAGVAASPASLSPRAVAPEKLAGLSAMRELANLSAQAAIDRHSRSRLINITQTKLLVAASALAAGGVMLWAWWHRSTHSLIFYGALVSFLVALVWGIQYAMLTGRLIINGAGHFAWVSKRWKREANPDELDDGTSRPESDRES